METTCCCPGMPAQTPHWDDSSINVSTMNCEVTKRSGPDPQPSCCLDNIEGPPGPQPHLHVLQRVQQGDDGGEAPQARRPVRRRCRLPHWYELQQDRSLPRGHRMDWMKGSAGIVLRVCYSTR